MASLRFRPRAHSLVATNAISSAASSVRRGLGPGLALAWYVAVVLPEAQTVFHRQMHRKDAPWTTPNRSLTFVAALSYCASLPGAAVMRLLRYRKAATLFSTALFVNPPTLLILSVALSEVGSLAGRLVKTPFKLIKRSKK